MENGVMGSGVGESMLRKRQGQRLTEDLNIVSSRNYNIGNNIGNISIGNNIGTGVVNNFLGGSVVLDPSYSIPQLSSTHPAQNQNFILNKPPIVSKPPLPKKKKLKKHSFTEESKKQILTHIKKSRSKGFLPKNLFSLQLLSNFHNTNIKKIDSKKFFKEEILKK